MSRPPEVPLHTPTPKPSKGCGSAARLQDRICRQAWLTVKGSSGCLHLHPDGNYSPYLRSPPSSLTVER